MIYSEEQANIILNHGNNLSNRVEKDSRDNLVIKKIQHGTEHNDRKSLSTEERVLIGSMARAGFGTHQEIADEMGLAKSTVTNASQGRTTFSTHPRFVPHPELEEKILDKLEPVREKALQKLMQSLDVISEEKLEDLSAKDASVVASNMSKIVVNTLPKNEMNDNRIQIVMYGPKQKELKDFEVVEV